MQQESKNTEYLDLLNPQQKDAVLHVEGPLLILAGAGTGKTRVLTTRIINLINEAHAFPNQILAVTFTNKAANEMQQRIATYLGEMVHNMHIGTFHSINAKILRKHAQHLGYSANYTIINTDDQLRLAKQIVKDFGFDEKTVPAKSFLYYINRFKDRAILPDNVVAAQYSNFANNKLAELYKEYQARLLHLNAMDFGDLILNVIKLFNENLEICQYYQNRYKYLLVDEYQDTNIAQYLWLRNLTQNNHNICCVGDDDQSIYAWRGAEITNILRFDKDFLDTKIVRLEQNYRSTQRILKIAGHLINNNKNRHGKNLWSEKVGDQDVRVINFYNDKEESKVIADEIDFLNRSKGSAFKDIGILVRAGYQTRNFEESFNFLGLPYKIVGNTKFYDRAEVKDVIAYIRLVVNHGDNLAFERVVNIPKRGVGGASLKGIVQIAKDDNISYFAATKQFIANKKSKLVTTLTEFLAMLEQAQANINNLPPFKLVEDLIMKSGYMKMWQQDTKDAANESRVENIKELIRSLEDYKDLAEFLEYIALISDVDNMADDNRINIMTIHAAKGLEFDTVFLPGWEEGVFPSAKSLEELKEQGLEEERRLAYVAITRAKKNLCISYASYRRIFGETQHAEVSRFVNELPQNSYTKVNNYFHHSMQKNNAEHSMEKKQSLKQQINQPMAVGSKVEHEKFGKGIVLSSNDDFREIFFEQGGVKKIRMDFLKEL
jgi:DNA helicase-2/ATP-dependent DNA helicase PcrA